MNDSDQRDAAGWRRTPLHLWIVGVVSLLWNALGATDYLMTQTRNATYLKAMTAQQMAWIDRLPAWGTAAWALGVWGALAGSILLLARKRQAVAAFLVSLLGVAGTTLLQYVVMPPPEAMRGPASIAMSVAIWAAAIGLLLYARAMRGRGVLR